MHVALDSKAITKAHGMSVTHSRQGTTRSSAKVVLRARESARTDQRYPVVELSDVFMRHKENAQ